MLYPWNTYRMRSYSMDSLKMLCMHEKSCKLIFIFVKPEKHTKSYVVYSTLHSTIHGLCVIIIVVFWTCRMKLLIAFLVICLLEKNICTDSSLLELAVIFYCCCGNVDIYTADCSVFVLNAVDCLDTLKNILDRIVYRILSGLDCQTLVSHILKCCYFFNDFFLCEFLSCNMLVFQVVWTINASVHTVV